MGPSSQRRALNAAEAHGFAVMITADQSLEYQQNLKGRKLALVVVSKNRIGVLEKHPEKLVGRSMQNTGETKFDFIAAALSRTTINLWRKEPV